MILIELKGEADGIIDGAVLHHRRAADVLPRRIGIHVDVALPNLQRTSWESGQDRPGLVASNIVGQYPSDPIVLSPEAAHGSKPECSFELESNATRNAGGSDIARIRMPLDTFQS